MTDDIAREVTCGLLLVSAALVLTGSLWAQAGPSPGAGDRTPLRDWFVAPGGDDAGPGTRDKPFATIQKGADSAGPGETVYIAGGKYVERVTLRRSGRMVHGPIRIQAVRGQKVVVTPGAAPGYAVINTGGADYIVLSGLAVEDSPAGVGIAVVGSWTVTLEDCRTARTPHSGIIIDKSGVVTVNRCEVEKACMSGGEESVSVKRSQHVSVSHCHIHDTGHEGIDVKEGSQHVRVFGNHLHGVDRQALYADAWDTLTADIEFTGNRVHDCGFGIALGAETGGLLSRVSVTNNLVYRCRGPGIILASWGGSGKRHPLDTITITHNTIWRNGDEARDNWGGGIVFDTEEAANVSVCNNILSRNGWGQLRTAREKSVGTAVGKRPGPGLVIRRNLIDGPTEDFGAVNVAGDPKFADTERSDFRLVPGSAAIDAAAGGGPATDFAGTPRPQGRGFDIGAFEFTP